VILGGHPIPFTFSTELTDERVLDAAKHGLECIVEAQLQDVRLRFAADYQAASRRTRLAPDCPDLYSALYYQLARLIVDERPWTNCANCGYPMLLTRPNRKTCSDACRQAKRRRSKATRESSR
jgi:predicted nucleic acid-binding Zn ribbon protein